MDAAHCFITPLLIPVLTLTHGVQYLRKCKCHSGSLDDFKLLLRHEFYLGVVHNRTLGGGVGRLRSVLVYVLLL